MFQRILVPLDFSDKNLRSLEIAREIALQNKASVVLLHVIEIAEHIPFDELKGFYRKLEETARELETQPISKLLVRVHATMTPGGKNG